MTETVNELTADQLERLLAEHGSKAAVARHLGRSESTVRDWYRQAVQNGTAKRSKSSKASKGLLTREHLTAALTPPNNCAVRVLLDQMDDGEREVLEECLGYEPRDFSAKQIIDMLIGAGYVASELPGTDAINDHRAGRRPCRCRG